METPLPWLRYVDASDLDNSTITFEGLPVQSPSGEKLGKVDGAIVDVSSGRPYYVAVDAGGWFKSKYFLLPIGHVSLSDASDRLIADIGKDRVERFPGFDRGEFEKLSDDDLARLADRMSDACCPPLTATPARGSAWTTRPHYSEPVWWRAEYYVIATPSAGSTRRPAPSGSRVSESPERERERVVAQGGDVSPHPGGRAQPGDVMGLETGGEETHIGDTSEEENERRRAAESAGAKRARE